MAAGPAGLDAERRETDRPVTASASCMEVFCGPTQGGSPRRGGQGAVGIAWVPASLPTTALDGSQAHRRLQEARQPPTQLTQVREMSSEESTWREACSRDPSPPSSADRAPAVRAGLDPPRGFEDKCQDDETDLQVNQLF